jgi:hypothetical protein
MGGARRGCGAGLSRRHCPPLQWLTAPAAADRARLPWRGRSAARGTEHMGIQLPTDPGEYLRVVPDVAAAPHGDDTLVLTHAHACADHARLPDGLAHQGEEQLLPQAIELHLQSRGCRWRARRRSQIIAIPVAFHSVQPAAAAGQRFLSRLKCAAEEVVVVARLQLSGSR